MTLDEKLEMIKKPSHVEFLPYEVTTREVDEAVAWLRREEHAIAFDTVKDHKLRIVVARVTHYRTCIKCLREGGTT